MRPFTATLSTALLLALLGCDEPETAVVDAASCQPTACPALEVASGDPISAETSESGDTAPAVPVFRVGTNEAGETDPMHFLEAVDGAPVKAVLGGQGAWMVVVAAATNQFCCVDRVNVKAQLASPDGTTVYGQLQYRKRPVFEGAEGMRYLMNVWLVLPADDTVWNGKEAVLHVELEPYGGGLVLTKDVKVVLQKS